MQPLNCDKNHGVCVASISNTWQTASMESDDKNGGPNHLRAWREHRGWSQDRLAKEVGTTQHQIAYLERGERALSAKWLRRLADALNTTPGHILDFEPDDIDNDIIDLWSRIALDDKDRARKILKALSTGTDG